MTQIKNVNKNPILNLHIELNTKDEIKVNRILRRIQEVIEIPLYIDEIYKSDPKEFTVYCYLISEFEKTNDSIVWALTTLDKIGEEWYIECPNLNHKEYWKFKGMRINEWNTFKINGIKKIDFDLTNLKKVGNPKDIIS
ncbi:hypothetical protein [uncultured Aquimarina sp.]|uniref:hypothetical protein n=1 Tax=uncultured Aquimarina sp. TaxID=575652 RepID=UPI00261B3833|nr:hypothetical protein [uncultured Aquimarina sp.]